MHDYTEEELRGMSMEKKQSIYERQINISLLGADLFYLLLDMQSEEDCEPTTGMSREEWDMISPMA